MKQVLVLSVFAMLLSACGGKTFEPLYSRNPALKPLPKIEYVDERNTPDRERKELVASLAKESIPSEDDYFNNPGAKKNKNGGLPTVIIAVPEEVEVSRGQSKKKGKDFNDQNDLNKVFRTSGYYNEAEQAIERALLRIGFNVLDRSKFEAKLRDLRDRALDRPWYWEDWTEDLLESGEYDIVKEQYKKQLQEGKINPQQYTEIINEVDKQSQRGLPGSKREEDEMNDIAEVIRAAQTGADQADYLLQINEVSVADAGDRSIGIKDLEEVQEFMNGNEGLKFGSLPKALPSSVSSKWLRAEFNAKLIEIKSGSIVWLGSHELESWSAEDIELSFDIQKFISNEEEINGSIAKHNAEIKKLNSKLETVGSELTDLYKEASTKKKMGSKTELATYKASLIAEIDKLEAKYDADLERLNDKLDNPPLSSRNAWEYEYDISNPIINPDLLNEGRNSIQGEQKLLKHRKELIKTVTQDLIKTIVIN